jgi:uncharacterized membrane protein
MTITSKWYTMDGKEGVDLNNIQSSVTITNDPSVPAPRAKLGDRVQGNNGSEWMFVIAGLTVTCFNFVAISNGFSAQNCTTAIQSSAIYVFGIAEFFGGISTDGTTLNNAQTGDYFWAMMKVAQGARVNIASTISVAPGSKLYVSQDTPGFLSTSTTTSTSQFLQIVGPFVPVSCTSGSSTGNAYTIGEIGMYTYPYPAVLVSAQAASV